MAHNIIRGRYLNHSGVFVFLCMIILIVAGCESSDSNTPPFGEEQLLFSGTGPDTIIDTIDVSHPAWCDNGIPDPLDHLCDVKHNPWGVAATPDGSYVYVTNQDTNNVTVINTSGNSIENAIDVGRKPMGIAVLVLPGGSYIYVANNFDDTVSVIDISDYSVSLITDPDTEFHKPQYLAASSDGNYVYVTNFMGNSVSVIDTATNAIQETIDVGENPTGIAVSPDGNWVYVAISQSGDAPGESDTVAVLTTTFPRSVDRTITVGNNPQGVAVTLDSRYVYVANSTSSDGSGEPGNTVSAIDITDDSVSTITVGEEPTGITVSPDGYMYVANWTSESLSVINTNDHVSYEGEILLGYDKPQGIAITEIAGTVYAYVASEHGDAVIVLE